MDSDITVEDFFSQSYSYGVNQDLAQRISAFLAANSQRKIVVITVMEALPANMVLTPPGIP